MAAHNRCYVIIRVAGGKSPCLSGNWGSAEARGGGVLYYWKAADSLFLCGGLSGDCVWWLVTLCGQAWRCFTEGGGEERTSAAVSMINVEIVAVLLCEQPSLRGR